MDGWMVGYKKNKKNMDGWMDIFLAIQIHMKKSMDGWMDKKI